MNWFSYYQPPEASPWQGRADLAHGSCFFHIIQLVNLKQPSWTSSTRPAFALLGFRCDEGVKRNLGRPGAINGPNVLREALAKLPLQRADLVIYDAGNISCEDDHLEEAQQALGEAVSLLLQQGITPILLGGGHEIAWGHYQGIVKALPNENVGIVNFDAHFDMRPLLADDKGSSGTPFLQIAQAQQQVKKSFDYSCIGIQPAGNIPLLFATMNKYHGGVILAEDIHLNKKEKCASFVESIIKRNQYLYITICLDVFSDSDAPGVSAPQILGLTPWQVIPMIRTLAQSGKAISYDLAEFSPKYDIDNRTARLAASLIFEIVHHHRPATGTTE
jgi:formiminoglutamase